jgi:drug/metabolite transporter (DMT)-like permease
MDIVLALLASLFFAIGTVVQQTVAAKATAEEAMQAGFLIKLAKQPVWLAGIAVDALGFVCQAAALGIGRISVVQPLLATTVVFALPLGVRYSGQTVGRRQIMGAIAVTAGLGVFLVVGDPSGGIEEASFTDWVIPGGICLGVTALLTFAAWGRRPRLKATFLGLAAGVLFAVCAGLIKASVDQLSDGVLHVFENWEVYALIAIGWVSMSLNEAALQTGELAPALATATVLDPVVSLILGVTLFQESLTRDPVGLAVCGLALVSAVVGIVILAAAEVPPGDAQGDATGEAAPVQAAEATA